MLWPAIKSNIAIRDDQSLLFKIKVFRGWNMHNLLSQGAGCNGHLVYHACQLVDMG